jgi:hypothetical protein
MSSGEQWQRSGRSMNVAVMRFSDVGRLGPKNAEDHPTNMRTPKGKPRVEEPPQEAHTIPGSRDPLQRVGPGRAGGE